MLSSNPNIKIVEKYFILMEIPSQDKTITVILSWSFLFLETFCFVPVIAKAARFLPVKIVCFGKDLPLFLPLSRCWQE